MAAGLAPAAIGSDTGGSVRIPASLVGITALKTTGGLISLRGAFPLSSSLDTIGPMTRSVDDTALLTAAMAEPDKLAHLAPRGAHSDGLAGKRIVVLPPDQAPLAVDPAAAAAVDRARATFQALGARLIDRRFPFDFSELMRRNGHLIAAEAYSVHRAYVEDAALPIGPWVRARLLNGKGISAADYLDVLAHRRVAREAWIDWMSDADAMLTPTLPVAACRVEEVDETTTPLAAFTRAGNYLDACALSLPGGFAAGGLPVGIQLLGKPFDEATLLALGRAFQRATDWHLRAPDLSRLFA